MPGPTTERDALIWIKEAMGGRPLWAGHLQDRCRERGFSIDDAKWVVRTATRCEPYDGIPRNGGSCWRVFGLTLDEKDAVVGVEAFRDHLGRRVVLVTVF